MHIPDGPMEPAVWIAGWLVAVVVVAFALRRTRGRMDEKTMPLMAVLAAGIFVAQMLNFPIGGGTSGHLLGAALAVFLLGPWAAMLIMSVILVIQALVFGDGGVTALGLNILNMAIIAPLAAWFVFRFFGEKNRVAAVPVAAWVSVFLTGIVVAAELALSSSLSSGVYGIPGTLTFPTLAAANALIGLGEAAITAGIVLFLAKVSPEMLNMHKRLAEDTTEA